MPTAGRLAAATGLLVLGGAIALLGSRAFDGGGSGDALLREVSERQGAQFEQVSALVEEQLRARQEAALTQFFRLQSFRRFAAAGLEVTWIVAAAGGDPWRGLEAGGEARRVPRLAWDSTARAGWDDLARRLREVQDGVDPRVVEAFGDILDYAAARPWPGRSDLAAVRASGWSDPAVAEEWLSLNRALQARVDGLLAEF